MTAEHYSTFRSNYALFLWFKHARQVQLKKLADARAGKAPMSEGDWSSSMGRCGYCKRRMQELIHHMENIVRPYSLFLQKHRPEKS